MADLPPLATFEQFVDRLGYTPEGDEADRALARLVDASELIRDEAEEDWVDESEVLETVPRRVQSICIDAALRAFTNDEALTQRSIGDSSKSWDRSRREGGEMVYLTEAEKRAVRKAAGKSTFRAVTLVSPYDGTDSDDLLGS